MNVSRGDLFGQSIVDRLVEPVDVETYALTEGDRTKRGASVTFRACASEGSTR